MTAAGRSARTTQRWTAIFSSIHATGKKAAGFCCGSTCSRIATSVNSRCTRYVSRFRRSSFVDVMRGADCRVKLEALDDADHETAMRIRENARWCEWSNETVASFERPALPHAAPALTLSSQSNAVVLPLRRQPLCVLGDSTGNHVAGALKDLGLGANVRYAKQFACSPKAGDVCGARLRHSHKPFPPPKVNPKNILRKSMAEALLGCAEEWNASAALVFFGVHWVQSTAAEAASFVASLAASLAAAPRRPCVVLVSPTDTAYEFIPEQFSRNLVNFQNSWRTAARTRALSSAAAVGGGFPFLDLFSASAAYHFSGGHLTTDPVHFSRAPNVAFARLASAAVERHCPEGT